MVRATMAAVLAGIWRSAGPDPAGKPIPGLTETTVRRTLMYDVACLHIGIPAPAHRRGGLLAPADTYSPERDEPLVRSLFRDGDGWAVVQRLYTTAGELQQAVVDDLRGSGAAVDRRTVGSWALSTVGRHYWQTAREPDLAALADERVGYTDRQRAEGPLRALRMSRPEFAHAVADRFVERRAADWPVLGRAPAQLGLGHDRPPPLVDGPGDWTAGTDRAVYARYRRYFDASARSHRDTDRADPDRHVTRRFRHAAPADVATAEVDRACTDIGLAEPGHTETVVAVSRAVREGASTGPSAALGSAALNAWGAAAAELPGDGDDGLRDAVAAYVAMWTLHARHAEGVDFGGNDLLHKVVRRLWHHLHGREVEWDRAYGRAAAVELVKICFGPHHIRGRALLDTDPADPADERADEPVFDLREQRTFDLINAEPGGQELVRLVVRGDPRWRGTYAAVVPVEARYLTADEFAVICADLAA